MSARIDLAAYPDTTRTDLAIIKQLLALQIRLLAITSGLERDGQAVAHAKQDVAAVCRGDFNEGQLAGGHSVGDLVEPSAEHHPDIIGSGHDSSPSLGTADALSVGDGPVTGGDPAGPGHPKGGAQ